jgi:hypothetical protein
MIIEKHNSHGLSLNVTLSKEEAKKLGNMLLGLADNPAGHYNWYFDSSYITLPCKFEDDNDKFEDTDFSFILER